MSKWTVRRMPTLGWWVVRTPYGTLVPPLHGTHTEALAHADRMARTVEVTLPAPVPAPPVDVHRPAWHVAENFTRPWITSIGQFVHVSDRTGWGEQVDADLAEKYALALLAAAKHAKGELP